MILIECLLNTSNNMLILNLVRGAFLLVSALCMVIGDTSFVCSFSSLNGTLVIKNGYNDTQVERCLLEHKTAESLIFTHSNLTVAPNHVKYLSRLTALDVSYNRLTSVNMHHIPSVCHRLKYAVFDFNNISEIKKGHLQCFGQLASLYVANNRMKAIDPMAFGDHLHDLAYVHIIHNNLTSIDLSMAIIPAVKRHDKVIINASWNKISVATNEKHFTIEDVHPDYSFFAVFLHNNFTTINTKHYFELFNIANPLQLYRLINSGFDTRFNPYMCDCNLYQFHLFLKRFRPMDPDNPVFSPTCYNPVPLRGTLIYNVPDNQFNCSVTQRCPVGCHCTFTIATQTVYVTCRETYTSHVLPFAIPEADKVVLSIKSPSLQQLSYKRYLSNVTVLDLSQCSISTIETPVLLQLNSFTSVLLNDNHLSGLPKEINNIELISPTSLSLSGNQFTCDCHDVWFKYWLLRNQGRIVDVRSIVCVAGSKNGHVYIDIPDDQFVCTVALTVLQIIIIVSGTVSVILLLVVIIIKKKTTIHVLLIAFCKAKCFRSLVNTDKKYDIFMPHSCLDDVIVNDILAKLECHTPPYSVCIGDRDFHLGRYIASNIVDAIESSQTTMLILSNNFLKSNWCKTEFREVYTRYVRDNSNMIIVLLEDLDKKLLSDQEELRNYLKTHTYIRYTSSDRLFWAKLLRDLPISVRRISSTDRHISETIPLLSEEQSLRL